MDNFQCTHEDCVRNRNTRHRQQPQNQPIFALPPPPSPPPPPHSAEEERIHQQQYLQLQADAQRGVQQQVHEHQMAEQDGVQRVHQQIEEQEANAAVERERVHQQIEEEEAIQLQRNREQNEQWLQDELYGEHNQLSQEQYQEDHARIRQQPAPDDSSSDSDVDGHNNGPLFPPPGNNPPPVRLPPGGRAYAEPIQTHYLGLMDVQCFECHALHFDCEKLGNSTHARKRFGICCLEGKVQLPALPQWPQELQRLYENNQYFVRNICQYNNTFAFTSLGVEVDHHTVQGPGPAAFCIHGGLYHLMGSLLPEENDVPSFAQLYIHDPHEAVAIRQQCNVNLNADVLQELNDMLYNHHPYVNVFKHAHQILNARRGANQSDLRVQLHYNEATDARRYNVPTANEIAAIIPGDGTEVLNENCNIILRLQGGGL